MLQTLKELEKEEYKERYQIIKRQREIAKSEETPSIEKYRLKPNAMQVGFITNLRKYLKRVRIGHSLSRLRGDVVYL